MFENCETVIYFRKTASFLFQLALQCHCCLLRFSCCLANCIWSKTLIRGRHEREHWFVDEMTQCSVFIKGSAVGLGLELHNIWDTENIFNTRDCSRVLHYLGLGNEDQRS